jgi:hypothetical protein
MVKRRPRKGVLNGRIWASHELVYESPDLRKGSLSFPTCSRALLGGPARRDFSPTTCQQRGSKALRSAFLKIPTSYIRNSSRHICRSQTVRVIRNSRKTYKSMTQSVPRHLFGGLLHMPPVPNGDGCPVMHIKCICSLF